ncbi:MAG: hypothetical protein K6E50_02695 [Lachnospiraceae bacterium]|nr:hypothetical protein [Lachnospiraceae bacterium]
MSKEARKKKRLPRELVILLAEAFLLVFAGIPVLFMLFAGRGEAAAEMELVPRQIEEQKKERKNTQLYVTDSPEDGCLILPPAVALSVSEDTAGRRLSVELTREKEENGARTILADLDILESAELSVFGEEEEYRFLLHSMTLCSAECTPEATILRLAPFSEWKKEEKCLVMEAAGGPDTPQILVQAAEKLKENGVCCFVIDREDERLTEEQRAEFLRICDPDLYVRVESTQGGVTQAFCDESYYIPGLDSVSLAELLERKLLGGLGGPAGDVLPLSADDELRGSGKVVCAVRIALSGEEDILRAAECLAEGAEEAFRQLWP